MRTTIGSRPHLEDGDLVRYLDRELDREDTRLARAHLSTCAACAARLEAAERAAGGVRSWLNVLDEPAPAGTREEALAAIQAARFRGRAAAPRWSGRPMLQAAAMVALLLTAAFGTPPGRAWVSGAVVAVSGDNPGPLAQRLLDMLGREGQVAAAPPAPAPVPAAPLPEADEVARPTRAPAAARAPTVAPGTSAPVRFTSSGNYVLVRFDSRQRAGSATIWIRQTSEAVGQVVAGRRNESLQPTADGVRVRNGLPSRADYSITIPASYRFVRVRIADEPETVIAVSRAKRDWLWTISLAAGDAVPSGN